MYAKKAGRTELVPEFDRLLSRSCELLEIPSTEALHELADALAQHRMMIGCIDKRRSE
jgi:hypothetical protein